KLCECAKRQRAKSSQSEMKVLFYNHTGLVSGAERVLLMILNGIDRQRYEPIVVCPADSPMMELAEQAGVRTRGLATLHARFTWRFDRVAQYLLSFYRVISDARDVVRDENPAFIHANSIRAGLVMSAATIGFKVPEEHTSELQSPCNLVCRLLLEKKKFCLSVSLHFA